MLALMLAAVRFGGDGVITVPVMNLSFCFDGFRKLYGTVVCFMWLISALLSPQYFRHHDHLRRYYFFFLLCLGFTAGVFLSADLYTTFLFFELMSLGSYVWVVQEETEGALAAGKTYLTIAVLGGLVTLMGLLLLHHLTGTLVISELRAACAAVENRRALWAAALCVLFGFGAKAGVFPLHICCRRRTRSPRAGLGAAVRRADKGWHLRRAPAHGAGAPRRHALGAPDPCARRGDDGARRGACGILEQPQVHPRLLLALADRLYPAGRGHDLPARRAPMLSPRTGRFFTC